MMPRMSTFQFDVIPEEPMELSASNITKDPVQTANTQDEEKKERKSKGLDSLISSPWLTQKAQKTEIFIDELDDQSEASHISSEETIFNGSDSGSDQHTTRKMLDSKPSGIKKHLSTVR